MQAGRNSSQIRQVLLDSVGLDWAGLGNPTKRSKAGFIPARPALPLICSRIRSQSKAPKMPPSHGLTGFVAIEVVAKTLACGGRAAVAKTGGLPAVMQGAPDEILPPCKRPMKPDLRAAFMPDAAQSGAAGAKHKAGAARIRMFSLSFRERIQGPKNASIAQFDGLCCY